MWWAVKDKRRPKSARNKGGGMEDDYNFLRVGGRTFSITEVNVPTVDALLESIKQTSEARVAAAVMAVQRDAVQEANTLSTAEHERIIRRAEQGQVAVPASRATLPLVVINGQLCPVKSVVYAPNALVGSWGYWSQRSSTAAFWDELKTRVKAANGDREPGMDAVVHVTCIPRIEQAVVVSFALTPSCVAVNAYTWHSMSSIATGALTWYKLCVGNTPATEFWNVSFEEFVAQVNRINVSSMSTTRSNMRGIEWSLPTWLNRCMSYEVRVTTAQEVWDARNEPA